MTAITTTSSLSVVASAVLLASPDWDMVAADAGFDGGEFSGPSHDRMYAERVTAALQANGWTAESYNTALQARTSPRFAHFSGLIVDEPEL